MKKGRRSGSAVLSAAALILLDFLKKSRSLYELERFPAVSRLLELRRELEADSGKPIDDDLLMHVAGKGAAFGLIRRGGGTRLRYTGISAIRRFSSRQGGEERRVGGERSPAMEPLGDTIFYASIDYARLVTALRRIALPLSSALGEGGSELPGITADIEIFSTLRSAVIRVDAAGRTISGEVDLSFGAP